MGGLLDDLLPNPAPTAKPKAGLLDDLLPPPQQPAQGGLLDDLLPSKPLKSNEIALPPGMNLSSLGKGRNEGTVTLPWQMEANPERQRFLRDNPELIQDRPDDGTVQFQGHKFQIDPRLKLGLQGARITGGQEAARAAGLTGGYDRTDTVQQAMENPMSTLSRATQRFLSPLVQTVGQKVSGSGADTPDAPNLLNVDDVRQLMAPEGEGRFATVREMVGLSPRAPYAQGEVMAPPQNAAERGQREVAALAGELFNPLDPLNILGEVAAGGAPAFAKVGRAIGDVLPGGSEAARALRQATSAENELSIAAHRGFALEDPALYHSLNPDIGYIPELPKAVPQDVSRGVIDNTAAAAWDAARQSGAGQAIAATARRIGEEAGFVRPLIAEANPVQSEEARIGGVNFVEPTPPPLPPEPVPPPMPRGDLPSLAPGAELTVPQRFDPLAILPESLPQRELTIPSANVERLDEMLRPRQTEFRPTEPVGTAAEAAPAPVAPEATATAPEAPAAPNPIFAREKAPNNIPFTVDRSGKTVRQWLKLTAKEKKTWAKMTPEQRLEAFSARAEQRGGQLADAAPRSSAQTEAAPLQPQREMALPQQGELLKPPPLNTERPLTLPKMEFGREPVPPRQPRQEPGILDDLLPDHAKTPEAPAVAEPVPEPVAAPEPLPAAPEAAAKPDPDALLRRSFGESEDSPFYEPLRRVQREIDQVEAERARVEQKGAGPLSREQRTQNMKLSDELRTRAQKLQAEHDFLRKQAAEEAKQFEAAMLPEPEPVPVPEAAAAPKKSGNVSLSAFGAAELQQALAQLDKLPVQLYQALVKLGDRAVSAVERTAAGNRVLRNWRHYMKPGGNAPAEIVQMGERMNDHLSAVSQQIADELVPMLRGDQRTSFLNRLLPNGKWSTLEQQAVGDVIKGDAPRVPLPAGGQEAAAKAKTLMIQDALDVLSQTLAVDRSIMGEMTQSEVIELGDLIRGRKPLTQASTAKLENLAQKSLRELEKSGALGPADANGVRAIKDSLLNERTFFRRAGRYMPRLYNKFEWDQLAQDVIEDLVKLAPPDLSAELRQTLVEAMQPVAKAQGGIQGNRMKTIIRDRFLRRKDLPPELRQALGEILEPAFPIAKGHYQLRQAIEQQKMNRFIASNPEWVRPEGEIGFYDHATKRPYVKMDEDPAFGVLSNRLVHPDVADYLHIQKLQGSAGEKFYDQIVSAWKFNKVVMNPASHARNLMSNVIMADIAGMGLNFKAHAEAAGEFLARSGMYEEARAAGVMGGTFHENEIRALANGLLGPAAADNHGASWMQRIPEYMKGLALPQNTRAGHIAGQLAEAEDQVFKFSLYRHMRNQGMSIEDAAQYVKDWMPNYRQNGRLVQIWAGKTTAHAGSSGVEKGLNVAGKFFANPFINFTASALPKAAKAALGIGLRKGEMRAFDPMIALRFWKYPTAVAGITAASAKALGMTSAEVEATKPDYMRNWLPGNYMLMPWLDENGRMQHVDLSYILPWGDFTKMRFNQDDPSPPPTLSANGPAAPLFEALVFNKSLFNGKEIWQAGMTDQQKNARIIDHIYRAWMPALAPGIPGLTGSEASLSAAVNPEEWKYALSRSGGSSASKIFSSLFQIPDYKGRQRAIGTTLADVFLGLKAQPVDPAATMRQKGFDRVQVMRNIDEEIRRVRKDQGWGQVPDVQQRYIQRLQQQKQNILRGGQVQQNPMLQDLFDSIIQPPDPGAQPVGMTGPQA